MTVMNPYKKIDKKFIDPMYDYHSPLNKALKYNHSDLNNMINFLNLNRHNRHIRAGDGFDIRIYNF